MGQKVVIVGPPEVKKQMARLLREALARCGR